jgi:hypothetical protein
MPLPLSGTDHMRKVSHWKRKASISLLAVGRSAPSSDRPNLSVPARFHRFPGRETFGDADEGESFGDRSVEAGGPG